MCDGVPNQLSVDLHPGVRPQFAVVFPHADPKLARQTLTQQPSMQHQRTMQTPCTQYVPARGDLDPAVIQAGPEKLIRAYRACLPGAAAGVSQSPKAANTEFDKDERKRRECVKHESPFFRGKAAVSTQDAQDGR
jgi:hypothetical protein